MRIRDSAIVRRAVELGAGFLDTADIYGGGESERFVGEAFDAGAPRDEVQWLLDRSPVTAPITGTSSIAHLEELMC